MLRFLALITQKSSKSCKSGFNYNVHRLMLPTALRHVLHISSQPVLYGPKSTSEMFLSASLRLLNAKAKVGSRMTSRWTPYPEQMPSAFLSNASNHCGSRGRHWCGRLDGLGIEPRVGGHLAKILSEGIIWLLKTPLRTCQHLQLSPLHLSNHKRHQKFSITSFSKN